eukprot:8542228-Pyramimonas_sp.AAC.1
MPARPIANVLQQESSMIGLQKHTNGVRPSDRSLECALRPRHICHRDDPRNGTNRYALCGKESRSAAWASLDWYLTSGACAPFG